MASVFRSDRDSNPRWGRAPHQISSLAPSTTRTSLQLGALLYYFSAMSNLPRKWGHFDIRVSVWSGGDGCIDKQLNYHYVLKAIGWMSERSKEAVLKTVEVQASGGSNPSPSVRTLRQWGSAGRNLIPAVSHPQCDEKKGAMAERSKALPC